MPNFRHRWAFPLLLILARPFAAAAQQTPNTLRPGDDVRVHAPAVRNSRVRGTVVLYQGDTLGVRDLRSGSIISFPIASIQALARSQGQDRGRSSWRMARFGAFLGGAGGLAAGPLIATARAPKRFGQIMIASGVAGTLAGLGLGAVVGATFPREEWQRFRMPIVPILTAGPEGTQIGLTARLP